MKASTAEGTLNLVLGAKLPGLLRSCPSDNDNPNPAHDPVASALFSTTSSTLFSSFEPSVHSFRFLRFPLSLLCLYVWMTLVSFLVRLMDLDGGHSVTERRSFGAQDRHRVGKSVKSVKSARAKRKMEEVRRQQVKEREGEKEREQERLDSPPVESPLMSPIVTLIVSPGQRFFVAHEDVLSRAPFFDALLKEQFVEDNLNKMVALPEEEPEILSCVLEFLYKGDYFPRLLRNKAQNTWELELEDAQEDPDLALPNGNSTTTINGGRGSSAATIVLSTGETVLRDTVIYCAAEKYGLEGLKRLALRKQGLQSAIPVDVILRSARYAYDNTPDAEYRLRAHYLAMIIRTRRIFKSSGTMQFEMEMGHRFFFDLFVAMCNHMDDLEEMSSINSFEMSQ